MEAIVEHLTQSGQQERKLIVHSGLSPTLAYRCRSIIQKKFVPLGNQANLIPNEKLCAYVRKQRQEKINVQKLWLTTTDKARIPQASVQLPSIGQQVILESPHQHQLPQLDRAVSCCGVGTP
ncbi:unnamed protein product [Allacma fusca]|uniref:Uncharacterized protein n=1 Tax=Allacma fusca TaxID=39272 RepID=A0A8J2J674_9HEXA|nr:unnamed protein product [Allacma fusca]